MTGPDPSTTICGLWVRLEPVNDDNRDELTELDWKRSQTPEMGGWFVRPDSGPAWGTMLFRSLKTGVALGVLDAAPLPGYADVVNVSIFADTDTSPAGWAMEAYIQFVAHLFEVGVRLVHHEVLEINKPMLRILRGAGIPSTARLRRHGYAAGRWSDVLIYSYDQTGFQSLLGRFGRRAFVRAVDRAGD